MSYNLLPSRELRSCTECLLFSEVHFLLNINITILPYLTLLLNERLMNPRVLAKRQMNTKNNDRMWLLKRK